MEVLEGIITVPTEVEVDAIDPIVKVIHKITIIKATKKIQVHFVVVLLWEQVAEDAFIWERDIVRKDYRGIVFSTDIRTIHAIYEPD